MVAADRKAGAHFSKEVDAREPGSLI